MKKTEAFFRLIRWPNLIFIALTQFLFYFIIFPFAYKTSGALMSDIKVTPAIFFYLIASSIFIAAAGYIINDYFDINIDQINKSSKVIVGNYINRRSAILLHALLSLAGLFFSFYAGWKLRNIYIPFLNLIAILLLVLYSSTFKKKLLVGNVIISLLTAWVIFVLTVSEFRVSHLFETAWHKLLKLSILYGGFAFIISLIREVVKDLEDLPGDVKFGCTTMPVVWGNQVSKVFVAVWIIVLCGLVGTLIVYLLLYGWWIAFLYGLAFVIIPLIMILKKLYVSTTSKEFHQLSTWIKWVMFTGILSMIFFI